MVTDINVKGTKPTDLVVWEDVEKTLNYDIGSKASLDKFTVKDFTQKGDNYACVVSSVEVKYKKYGKDKETSYVVKLNPLRSHSLFEILVPKIFQKETDFYKEMIPLFNKELTQINEGKLKVPHFFHSVEDEGKQVIYMEDLRKSGFKMTDRKLGIDKDHTMLILKELARFHAASVLVLAKIKSPGTSIFTQYPVLEEGIFRDVEGSKFNFFEMYQGGLTNSVSLLTGMDGYADAVEFLNEESENLPRRMKELLDFEDPFEVICHGDCWNNNFLFRYNGFGHPIDCRLLDLQITRVASLALDLNYFIFSSVPGDVRRENMDDFFNAYYSSFASVLSAARKPMPFTLDELKREYKKKLRFGLYVGLNLVPTLLMPSEETFDLDDLVDDEEKMMELMTEYHEKTKKMLRTDPNFKLRFLSIFDDMKEFGFLSSSKVDSLIKNFNSLASQ